MGIAQEKREDDMRSDDVMMCDDDVNKKEDTDTKRYRDTTKTTYIIYNKSKDIHINVVYTICYLWFKVARTCIQFQLLYRIIYILYTKQIYIYT